MKFTKAEKSWIMYDVANSAFSMIYFHYGSDLLRYPCNEGRR
jgi:hypothetical protein